MSHYWQSVGVQEDLDLILATFKSNKPLHVEFNNNNNNEPCDTLKV